MPQLGFGVYQIPNEDMGVVMEHAFKTGYRSIDTAQFYNNEQGLGAAIQKSGIARKDLFITTKVWNSHHGYEKTIEAFQKSLDLLQLDYIDLYLIHWPAPNFKLYIDTYKAMETLYEKGKIKALGVSNFDIEHLEHLLDECHIVPTVNQVECHPYFQQKEMKQFCKQHDIIVESWSPLYRGEKLLEEPLIVQLANKHHKTPAQIILRWHLQEACIVIPKSVTPKRIEENFSIFDFQLSEEDMSDLSNLDRGDRRGPIPKEMHNV